MVFKQGLWGAAQCNTDLTVQPHRKFTTWPGKSNVFNHQTSNEELAARPEPAAILKMKTNVWRRGPDRAPDLHLKDSERSKPLILLANSKHSMSEVHIFSYFASSLERGMNNIGHVIQYPKTSYTMK